MIDGVVFDMDGVLTDTEQAWIALFDEMVGVYGETLSEKDRTELFGCSDARENVVLGRVLDMTPEEVAPLKEQWCAAHQFGYGELAIEGNLQLARALRCRGIRCAIASSSARANVERMLDETGMDDVFAVVVTGDDIEHAKPAPDAYVAAADRLGIAPERLIAVDDSPVGVDAAVGAGLTTVQYSVNPAWDTQNQRVSAIVRTPEELERDLLARL